MFFLCSCVGFCAQVARYNGANREVAILCNHQRTVSSAQKEGLSKQKDRLEMLNTQKYVRPKIWGREQQCFGERARDGPIVSHRILFILSSSRNAKPLCNTLSV